MGNVVVRLYLLLLHSLNPQFHEGHSADATVYSDQTSYTEEIQGPLTLQLAGPLEHTEYILFEKEKKH